MKKNIFITFIFIISISYAQNENETLNTDMKNYIKANNESDFESLVEYYPEIFFDSISKNEAVMELEKFYSKESQNRLLLDADFQVDTILDNNKEFYARIRNGKNITIDLTEFKGENGMAYVLAMMYGNLVNEYGKENVKQGKTDWIFNIRSEKPVYALKKEDQGWKFIELNDETEKIIPIEIRASVKNN